MVPDVELSRSKVARLHEPWMRSATPQPERVLYGDVIVIHNKLDVLLVSCSRATNAALRHTLEVRGHAAAA
eukprot:4781712-Prymnesium_polylepis.1